MEPKSIEEHFKADFFKSVTICHASYLFVGFKLILTTHYFIVFPFPEKFGNTK